MAWFSRVQGRTTEGLDALRRPEIQSRLAAVAPAVVLPVSGGTGLGILRNLGRLGIPLIALDSDPTAMGLASRFAIPLSCHDPRKAGEEALIQDLERLGAALPRPAVLFPAFDDHVWALSRHADRLRRHFLLPQSDWCVMERVADKEQQLRAALEAGIDLPVTAFLHGPGDLEEAAAGMRFPALLKPIVPQEMRRRFGYKVIPVPMREDLPRAYERARVCGSLILQEIVPGEDDAFYTCGVYQDQASRPLGLFVSRKVRQHPRGFGEARIAESDWVQEVVDTTVRLLTALHFHGVSGTEFKRDPRDGRLKLMEVNARHWLHHPLATASGVNLSHIAYCDALGQPMEGGRQVDGVRWIDLPRELGDSLVEVARREMSLDTCLAGLRNVKADAVFSFDDLAPGFRHLRTVTEKHLRHWKTT
jgi:predicted ATP-grasp superfamily ATP-dependent carboligase